MTDILSTTAGDWPLEEVEITVGDRTWNILHTGAVISREQELAYLRGESAAKRPYGSVVWQSSIALAHEVATRGVAGKKILELGAGTGLPGIVAAALGANVVQTDRQKLVLHVCRMNAERNHVSLDHRLADWGAWTETAQYDLILGADILYAEAMHPQLRIIFETNLKPGGVVLLADPFRTPSMALLEAMEQDGWKIRLDKWSVGLAPPPRPVAVYTMTR
ncbi:methyltransferase domain-containing protein [soil metagenome]